MSGARCKHDLCELFDDVINFTIDIINTKDPGVDYWMKELPDQLAVLNHEREKVANEVAPILVLGMFFYL